MQWAKRFFLYVLVNALVVTTFSLFLSLFGLLSLAKNYEFSFLHITAVCAVWSVIGSLIFLSFSKKISAYTMGVQKIDSQTVDPRLQRILTAVQNTAEKAGLLQIPEVGIYNSPEVNAFAVGTSKNEALVAISTGLFQKLSPEELDGVIAHEVAHIANGDMVTMTLLQAVVNSFVMIPARLLGYALSPVMKNKNEDRLWQGPHHFAVLFFERVLLFFGMMVVSWFSRYREYGADDLGTELVGRNKMLAALQGLHRTYKNVDPLTQSPSVQTLKISSPRMTSLEIFSTHPPLEERILRLQNLPREQTVMNAA